MRLINADKVKAESREHCKTCILNGTKRCDKTCVINLICDRLDLQPTVELTTTVKGDLISRDALKTAIEDKIDYIPASEYDDGWNNAIYAVIDEIDNAPTVETSKVEHKAYNEGFKDGVEQGIKLSHLQGKWIVLFDENNIKTCKCSICGRIEDIADFDKYPFCHCGAQMYELKTS